MSQTVADVLVGALEEIGVKQIFGLIGDSLNPLADAVRRSDIEWIGVRHEEGAALAAAGQAKLTGRLAVCAGTTEPGSTHLVAGLYEASRDHAPVLALSGDMARKMHGTDFIQTTEPDLLFRDVSLYTETVSSSSQAPAVIHLAIAAAYAGRGVAHLTLPQDVIEAKADGAVSSLATLKPRTEIVPTEEDIVHIASRVDEAGSVVIMCGGGCHGAAEELRALSDRLKAPLIHSVKGKDIMPYDDPIWMGGIGMIGTKAVYNAVMHCASWYCIPRRQKSSTARMLTGAETFPTSHSTFSALHFERGRRCGGGGKSLSSRTASSPPPAQGADGHQPDDPTMESSSPQRQGPARTGQDL